jgi:hypothetical protein
MHGLNHKSIKAIETRYKGYRFRSRLEARWAVFFDHLGIRWEYEMEGFEVQGGRYLPDFWLPQVNMYAEVKPAEFTDAEITKCASLCEKSGSDVLLLIGPPSERCYLCIEYADFNHGTHDFNMSWMDIMDTNRYWLDEGRFYWVDGGNPLEGIGSYDEYEVRWVEQDKPPQSNDTLGGVAAARSARFEFGESGAT